jgi:hypothetical protein
MPEKENKKAETGNLKKYRPISLAKVEYTRYPGCLLSSGSPIPAGKSYNNLNESKVCCVRTVSLRMGRDSDNRDLAFSRSIAPKDAIYARRTVLGIGFENGQARIVWMF